MRLATGLSRFQPDQKIRQMVIAYQKQIMSTLLAHFHQDLCQGTE
jgi:hypothetical protein